MKHSKPLSFLALILALLICFTGCTGDSTSIMDSGADNFAAGKFEDDYSITGAGKLLDELIDKYSGSYYQPTGTNMTDDEFDAAQQEADSSDQTEDNSSSKTQKYEIGSYDDLVNAFHNAYDATATYLEYTFVDGYSVILVDVVEDIYRTIQRTDPIDACGVGSWEWGTQNGKTLVKIKYLISRDELIRIKKETVQLVKESTDEIRKKGTNDYELICAVNKYLCDKIVYPSSEPYEPITHTAYGALKNGLAVCEGYTCAAKLILDELNIDCDIQVGMCSNGEGHAWNLVYLEGNWYQMDVTWNDGSNDITDYLLVTDDFMRRSRTWDEQDYPKTATSAYKVS